MHYLFSHSAPLYLTCVYFYVFIHVTVGLADLDVIYGSLNFLGLLRLSAPAWDYFGPQGRDP